MGQIYDTEEEVEKVILVGVSTQQGDDTLRSLAELEELIETAGAKAVGQVVQNRERIHPGTYIGKGKVEELQELILQTQATGIVCDDELTAVQMNHLREQLDTKIMDRTLVILDIFAKRAVSSEGKIQVELAQLKYRASRLMGLGTSMSRLGGGIGTRGPGEKKLEMDRRLIRDRISWLKGELREIQKHRSLTREHRSRNHIPVAAIVGYTNAGKSTLLNMMTNADVLEENMLFATLDPTTRNLSLPSGQEILITDTVGFIRKLPHHLIDAFRSTLEEAKYADLLLHVVDASNPDMDLQMHTVYETLDDLGVKDKKIITLFNKQDLLETVVDTKDLRADKTLRISAKSYQGLDELKVILEEMLREDSIYIERVITYENAGVLAQIRKYGQLLEEEYVADGIQVKAYVPQSIYGKL